MRIRLLRAALAAILIGMMGAQVVHADIYTWVDSSGSINVSNLAPPDGVHVTNVMHETAPKAPPPDAARQADIRALAQRVQQLEGELAVAQNQAPPLAAYAVMQAPPVVQYFVDVAPPQIQYNSTGQSGCDPAWADCGTLWNAGTYPVGIVFVQAPNFRRFPPLRGGRQFAGPAQMRRPESSRRG
jgi:Domain of unknown function (DUF4124)